MTNLQQKFVTALATGAVVLSTFTSSAFAATITISGNGSDSNNTANVSSDNNVRVNQDNNATINNSVNVDSNTGGNTASGNTGGDVKVKTGDATTIVKIDNKANTNVADVNACCQAASGLDVKIAGNGSDSDNNVNVDSSNRVRLDQDNRAKFNNDVNVNTDTGDNSTDDNTGGNVKLTTGDAGVGIKIANAANHNSAMIGGGNGDTAGAVSALVTGNGSGSFNDISLDFNNNTNLDQDNNANFDNNVNVAAETGDNSADDNTGGDVVLGTGDANMVVELDNMANFNSADVNACGCVGDLEAKISGNGSDSSSNISVDTDNNLKVDQNNKSKFNNDVYGDLNSGDNSSDDNTGAVSASSDPSLKTGDSESSVKVNNSGNANVYGAGADMGDMLNGLHLNFTFNLGDLLNWLSSH